LRADGKATDVWLDETMSCSVEYLLSSYHFDLYPRTDFPRGWFSGNIP